METKALNLLSLKDMKKSPTGKAITGFAALLAVQVLIACSPNPAGQTVVNTTDPGAINQAGGITTHTMRLGQTTTAGNSSGSMPQGTGDLGGGDALHGKLIEEYAFDFRTSPEYTNHLAKIDVAFGKLKKIDPETKQEVEGLALVMMGGMLRQWFVAPVSLAVIEKSQLGVDFIKDPVQQMALQNDREIWIDKNLLPKDERERARLFLHESMMAFYMFQFDNFNTMCEKAHAITNCGVDYTGDGANTEEMKKLFEAMFAPRPRRQLTANDYANVRSVTNLLFDRYQEIKSYEDLKRLFIGKNFDPRLFGEYNKIEAQNNEEFRALKEGKFTPGHKQQGIAVAQDLYRRSVGQLLPTNCRFNEIGNATAKCQVKFGSPRKLDNKSILLPIEITVNTLDGKLIRKVKTQVFTDEEVTVSATSLASGMRNSNVGSILMGVSLPQDQDGKIQYEPREGDEMWMLTTHYTGSDSYSELVGLTLTPFVSAGVTQDWGADLYDFVVPANAANPSEVAIAQPKISGKLYSLNDFPRRFPLSKPVIELRKLQLEKLNQSK